MTHARTQASGAVRSDPLGVGVLSVRPLMGEGLKGGFEERMREPLLAAGQRLQQPCWRLPNGWRAVGCGQNWMGRD